MHTLLPAAHQYTRALMALTLTQASHNILAPALADTPAAENSARVARWLEACSAKLPKRPLSAGARRDLDAAFLALASRVETQHLTPEQRLTAWTANLWAARLLVVDSRITCKSVAHGKAWAYLEKTLETLAVKLAVLCEDDVESEGFEVYMNLEV